MLDKHATLTVIDQLVVGTNEEVPAIISLGETGIRYLAATV